jgi:hypothetical protein
VSWAVFEAYHVLVCGTSWDWDDEVLIDSLPSDERRCCSFPCPPPPKHRTCEVRPHLPFTHPTRTDDDAGSVQGDLLREAVVGAAFLLRRLQEHQHWVLIWSVVVGDRAGVCR